MLHVHSQTLRFYERVGFVKPVRTRGETRLYSHQDIAQLRLILYLTRDMGVNLAGVEIVLNMRRKMEQMQAEFGEFLQQLREELHRSRGEGLEEKIEQALVRLPPAYIMRAPEKPPAEAPRPPALEKVPRE